MTIEINKAKNNYPWPRSLRKLYLRYEEKRWQMGYNASFDEITSSLDMTQAQICKLQSAMASVMQPLTANDDEDCHYDDYAVQKVVVKLDPDQKQAIKDANLNQWEHAVLEGFLSGHWGWQSEVALNNINPITGKPYSRRAPFVALERIKEKIMRVYEKNKTRQAA